MNQLEVCGTSWSRSGADSEPIRSRIGADPEPIRSRFRAGFEPISSRLADLEPIWSRFAGLEAIQSRFGADSEPIWSRSGASSHTASGANLKLLEIHTWNFEGKCGLVEAWPPP